MLREELVAWGLGMKNFRLPRWHELPDLELYMDQVIKLVDQYLSPVIHGDKHSLLTSSMVNNYVKLGLIPPPNKKRYTRTHVAFLIAITTLKQVLTIPEIKDGIVYQGKAIGINEAYNLFVTEQEKAIHAVCALAQGLPPQPEPQEIPVDHLANKAATMAFANKLLAEKTIAIEQKILTKARSN